MDLWPAALTRRRERAAARRAAQRAERARQLARGEAGRIADLWDALVREDEGLAQAATAILGTFLKGAQPPRLRETRHIRSSLDQPWPREAWQWLIDNRLVVSVVVAAKLPVVRHGMHAYGSPGFNGYRVNPEARQVIRRQFGPETWTEP
jgi:hypothetical protein